VQRFLEMPILTCHPLHSPQFLSTKILPLPIKEWISQLYAECNIWLEENVGLYQNEEWSIASKKKVKEMLKSYEDYMYSEDLTHLLPKFIKYSNGLDAIRKESLKHSIPDLWEKLTPYMEE
jgi:hypothetical protein